MQTEAAEKGSEKEKRVVVRTSRIEGKERKKERKVKKLAFTEIALDNETEKVEEEERD